MRKWLYAAIILLSLLYSVNTSLAASYESLAAQDEYLPNGLPDQH